MKDHFHDVMREVLPYLWTEEMAGATKTSLKKKIAKHLEMVHAIADRKQENTITDDDLTGLQHHEILQRFVKFENTTHLP